MPFALVPIRNTVMIDEFTMSELFQVMPWKNFCCLVSMFILKWKMNSFPMAFLRDWHTEQVETQWVIRG